MADVKFTRSASGGTREEQRVRLVESIEGAPPLPFGYKVKREWIPTSLVVVFERDRHNGRDWSQWRMMSGKLIGHALRQDGSWGAERDERLHGYGSDPGGEVIADRLAVMAAAVERYGVDQPEHLEG